jgi:hypothetical protein
MVWLGVVSPKSAEQRRLEERIALRAETIWVRAMAVGALGIVVIGAIGGNIAYGVGYMLVFAPFYGLLARWYGELCAKQSVEQEVARERLAATAAVVARTARMAADDAALDLRLAEEHALRIPAELAGVRDARERAARAAIGAREASERAEAEAGRAFIAAARAQAALTRGKPALRQQRLDTAIRRAAAAGQEAVMAAEEAARQRAIAAQAAREAAGRRSRVGIHAQAEDAPASEAVIVWQPDTKE